MANAIPRRPFGTTGEEVSLLAVGGALRLAKGMLLILEYRNKAREGRTSDES